MLPAPFSKVLSSFAEPALILCKARYPFAAEGSDNQILTLSYRPDVVPSAIKESQNYVSPSIHCDQFKTLHYSMLLGVFFWFALKCLTQSTLVHSLAVNISLHYIPLSNSSFPYQ